MNLCWSFTQGIRSMDPMSWGTAIGGLLTIIVAIIGFFKYKRVKRENLAQAETDALKDAMDRVDATDHERVRVVPKSGGT